MIRDEARRAEQLVIGDEARRAEQLVIRSGVNTGEDEAWCEPSGQIMPFDLNKSHRSLVRSH